MWQHQDWSKCPNSFSQRYSLYCKSKLWKKYTFQENRRCWSFLGKCSFQTTSRSILGPSRGWNYVHPCGLTDDHDWFRAGPPRQELGQLKLIPTPGKRAQGTSGARSRDCWQIQKLPERNALREYKKTSCSKYTPSISTLVASRIPPLGIYPY